MLFSVLAFSLGRSKNVDQKKYVELEYVPPV